MSNKTSSLERPTLAERFVGIFHLPFLGGCLLVGFVLLGRPLNYLDFYVSGFVFDPVEFTFRNLFGIGEPLDPLFNLITGLLHTSYFFVPGYVRRNLLKAKRSVVPLLPGGEVEYQKIFGRVSALRPQTFLALGFWVFISFAYEGPSGAPSLSLNLYSNVWDFALSVFLVAPIFSIGLSSLVWTYFISAVGVRKTGRIPLKLRPHPQSIFPGLRAVTGLVLSLGKAFFAMIGLFVGQVILNTISNGLPSLVLSDVPLLSTLIVLGILLFSSSIMSVVYSYFGTLTDAVQQKGFGAGPTSIGSTSIYPVSPSDAESSVAGFGEPALVGNVKLANTQPRVGDELTYILDIANVGRVPASLMRLEGSVPDGFNPSRKQLLRHDVVDYMDLRGKKLEYLRTYAVKISVKAASEGSHELRPRILFVGPKGVYRSYEFEPITLLVKKTSSITPGSSTVLLESAGGLDPVPVQLSVADGVLEGVVVQAKLLTASRELFTNETFEVQIEISSMGTKPVIVEAVDNIRPRGLVPIATKGGFLTENGGVELRDVMLGQSDVNSLSLIFKASEPGKVSLAPVVCFRGEAGDAKRWQLPPTELLINGVTPMIDFLIGVFIDDYMERRLDLDQSGWRSLTDIARAMNIPQSQVYGDPRYGHDFGSALEPLIKQGLVEYRIFEGKGRGGKVVKVRAHYEREPIRRRVDTEAWKPSRQTA